ncbi:MAG: alpha-amylase family glycosyl hydrolase, partial [bacterium]
NHTPEGTFAGLRKDLERIKDLGVDVLYLLPIHPIGVKNRKGTLGSPYSIRDYREINPELGTMADFSALIQDAHAHGLRLVIDVVFNHTSRDSRLLAEHPEWFYKNTNGEIANRVGAWWDITDFDFKADRRLWVELADTLCFYAELGVDGFRSDVASLVPIEFWRYARKRVDKINRRALWISESVHGGFIKHIRDRGFEAWSEAEVFQVFDMAYDYDVQPYMDDYLLGKRPFRDYLDALARQEEIYPSNYVKMHNLENHDFPRIAAYLQGNVDKIRNWTGLLFFLKGAVMLYAGEEYSSDVRPDLFERDPVVKRTDISPLVRMLARLKKKAIFATGVYEINRPEIDGVAYNTFANEREQFIGIFNVAQVVGRMSVTFPDGRYRNLISNKTIKVENGSISLGKDPIIIKITK